MMSVRIWMYFGFRRVKNKGIAQLRRVFLRKYKFKGRQIIRQDYR